MTTKKQFFSILMASFIILAALAAPVGAVSENAGDNAGGTNSNSSDVSQSSNQSENAQSGKLDEDKLQACQGVEQKIKNMFENMNQLGQGQLNLFDNVANKVQNFYENSGLDVANYDELVGEMEQARTAAREAMQNAVQISSSFGCDSDDPKGSANEYKVQVRTQIQELKNYRAAIKNMVSAIKDAVAAEETTEE